MSHEEKNEDIIIDYRLFCTGTDLDAKGYFCAEDTYLNEDFICSNNDYQMLSNESPSISE